MTTATDGGVTVGHALGLTVLTVFLSAVLLVMFFLYAWAEGSGWVHWSKPASTIVLVGMGWTAASVAAFAVGVAAIRAAWKVDGPGVIGAVILGVVALLALVVPAYIASVVIWSHAPVAFHPGRANYPLVDAACRGDTQAVKTHLRAGLSATYQYQDGELQGDALARHWQCLNPDAAFNFELVDALIAAGSTLNPLERFSYDAPLHRVLERVRAADRTAALKFLVERGASTETLSANQASALTFAARNGDAESVRTLLALGARVDSEQLARTYREMRFCGEPEEGAVAVPEKMKPYLDVVAAVFQAGATVTWDELYRLDLMCGQQEHLIGQYIRTQYPSSVLRP